MGQKNGVVSSGAGLPNKQKAVRGGQTLTVNTSPIKIADTSRARKNYRQSKQIVNTTTKKKSK